MAIDLGLQVLAILPEIGLLVLAGLVLVLDLTLRNREGRGVLGWTTAIGLVVIAGLAVAFARPAADPTYIFGGMLRLDGGGFVFRMIFLLGASLTALFATESDMLRERGEFYLLLLISALGMSLMASSADLVMLYLAIETTSIPLYVLAGFVYKDQKSVESGIKYLLFGAVTSAVMLFGFSFLYGFTGQTNLYVIAQALVANDVPHYAVIAVLLLVLVGFGFKISAAPFHFWAPDVYEGAPTPVAGFLSTASKAAGFAVLLRVLASAFSQYSPVWTVVIGMLAVLSMFVGNLLALSQKNIKRLLAYSSIGQAGYILIGVAANTQFGTTAAVYYLMSYLVTNLAAFGIVTLIGRATGSDEISSYAGLSRRSPGMALALLVALLSLGGLPPFAGFFGKLLVFGAAIDPAANQTWLAILGILNSIIGLYYYLTVLKVVYLYRSEDETRPLASLAGWKTALVVCVVSILVLGVVFAPWYALSTQAANGLLMPGF
jgi:NADH-quinone oxidoreductase subunit N